MAASRIEWTQSTWNPVTGCSKVSSGCKNCYAERMAKRLRAMGQQNYTNGFKVTCHPQSLELPLKWRRSHRVFVNSMSDLFHERVPIQFIEKVFRVMNQADWHEFQVLTKRAHRLQDLGSRLTWTENIWLGVTVEDAQSKQRIDCLRRVPAVVRFLSVEPLLESLGDLDLTGIGWVIVGGESGPGARPLKEEWVRDIRDQCLADGVKFFFKQWGGVNKKKHGRLLEGRTWDDYPRLLQTSA